MSDIKGVIDAVKRIDTLLAERFGPQRRGLQDKLNSVEHPVPAPLRKTIRGLTDAGGPLACSARTAPPAWG